MRDERNSRAKILIQALAGLLLMACLIYAFGQRRRPASPPQGERARRVSSAGARTIRISAKGDFQAALNGAEPGDTILLEAGASFTGPFTDRKSVV